MSADGIALMAHELSHTVEQDSYDGPYVKDYFGEGRKKGFGRQNRLETKHYQLEDRVKNLLRGNLTLLMKIANGIPLTEAEKEEIRRIGEEERKKKEQEKAKQKNPTPNHVFVNGALVRQ